MTLTHFKNKNQTIEMVDISKKETARIAVAESLIKVDKNSLRYYQMIKIYFLIYVLQLKLQEY